MFFAEAAQGEWGNRMFPARANRKFGSKAAAHILVRAQNATEVRQGRRQALELLGNRNLLVLRFFLVFLNYKQAEQVRNETDVA